MRALFFIAALFLIVSCGEKPQPNQDLLSAYELLKKGEFEKAQTLADSAEVLTEADSALYCIVSGAIAVVTFDLSFCDTVGIEKCINLYDDDKEKLAWAYLIRGGVMYGLDSRYDAVLDYRHAEKLAEDTDCNELKFIMNFRLAHCNINSYNFEVYNELSEKMKKYAVTSFDSAEYYYLKGAMYECGLISVDSAKYYIKKAVECVENAHYKTYVDVFFYYSYAELICDEDDSLAEKYILKSFEFDTLRQAYSVLGKIYLKRGDDSTAKQYFAKSSKGNYWEENEERVNRWLHEYYAGKQNYSAAYGYALKQMAAKDSILDFVRTNNIKPIQTKFEGEIEQLKLKSALEKKIFLTISISAVILAVLVLTVVFQKLKLAERQRKIFEAQQTINSYNQKISELTTQNQTQNAEEIDFLRQKVKALELKFSEIYVSGKNLYAHVLADNKIGRWSKEDYRNFIDYYQSLEFLYVRSFETDFISLTDRQKIFLILCHIGKTKEQIMQIMTLEESSFRSLKSRIEGQKKRRTF